MKIKGHTIYRLENGDRVPSVTTVTAIRSKPALTIWSNRLGLQGTDSVEYARNTADVGKLLHSFIADGLNGLETSTSGYSNEQISLSEKCYSAYERWVCQHQIDPLLIEEPLVSERYKYGGTPDLFGTIDGVLMLVDFKSGNRIWPDHIIQLGGYRQLLQEAGHKVDAAKILNFPQDNPGSFTEHNIDTETLDQHFEIFLALLKIHRLEGELSK